MKSLEKTSFRASTTPNVGAPVGRGLEGGGKKSKEGAPLRAMGLWRARGGHEVKTICAPEKGG